eukprot:scaffold13563_cov267-Alexandrium_tamarense.AAC.7
MMSLRRRCTKHRKKPRGGRERYGGQIRAVIIPFEGCASAVKRILGKVEGVTDIQTNVEAKSVAVTHGDSVSKQEMLEKLQKGADDVYNTVKQLTRGVNGRGNIEVLLSLLVIETNWVFHIRTSWCWLDKGHAHASCHGSSLRGSLPPLLIFYVDNYTIPLLLPPPSQFVTLQTLTMKTTGLWTKHRSNTQLSNVSLLVYDDGVLC